MVEELRALEARFRGLDKRLSKLGSQQVHSPVIKRDTQSVVDDYFRSVRGTLLQGGFTDDELGALDNGTQSLLEHCHRHVTVSKYRKTIKRAVSSLVALEQLAHTASQRALTGRVAPDRTDALIVTTLQQLLPSAAAAYEQAVRDLQTDNRLSWRGPATDLREALREVLDHLAPDDEVERQPGYQQEADTHGPTMRQKVRFVLRKRGLNRSATEAPENAAAAVDTILGTFVRSVYTRSAVSTHTPTLKAEVLRVRYYVRAALCELLEIGA